MNKRQFKIVAVAMTFAIMALALMQGLWLTRLYRQSVERYADQIRTAVTTALYRSRLDSRSVYSVTRMSAPVADSLVIYFSAFRQIFLYYGCRKRLEV